MHASPTAQLAVLLLSFVVLGEAASYSKRAEVNTVHRHKDRSRLRAREPSGIFADASFSIANVNDTIAAAWGIYRAQAPKIARGLDDATMAKVKQNLADHSSDSWVSGTRSEALLEYDFPQMSVFSNGYFGHISSGVSTAPEVTDIAEYWMNQLPADASQFVMAGAAGDTASVGVAFVNAGYDASLGDQGKSAYSALAAKEADWLVYTIPRMDNGAISHRPPNEQAQVWADETYMIPPYLAYYGVANNDIDTAKQAFTQISAIRDILRDPATGLWKHVIGGSWEDRTQWGTGMAWGLAGMTRVYATYLNSPYSGSFESEKAQLATWANELVIAVLPFMSNAGLLPNTYGLDRGFDDSASSALIASAIYRMAQLGFLNDVNQNIGKAEQIRQGVYSNLDSSSGWLNTCADPLLFYTVSNESPESMAFLVLLEAAVIGYKGGNVAK